MDLEQEVKTLKRRLDLAETKLNQHDGQFAFITGQLRDIQLYLHAKFADVDQRFDRLDAKLSEHDGRFAAIDVRFDHLESKVDALPRVIAELISNR